MKYIDLSIERSVATFIISAFILLVFSIACSTTADESEPNNSADGAPANNNLTDSGQQDFPSLSGKDAGSEKESGKDLGTFNIELKQIEPDDPDGKTTTVLGKICDDTPINLRLVIWEVKAEEAGCQVLEPSIPFCEQDCETGMFCVEGNVCAADPPCFDLGTVTIQGLQTQDGEETVTLTSVVKQYQLNAQAQNNLVFPPFSEADLIRLEATGGDLEPFAIETTGVKPLDLLSDEVLLAPDQPTTLEWQPAQQQGNSRIEVRIDISHHGGQKGELFCDVEDTGSLEIPASLVTELINLGYAGYPTVDVTRRNTGSTSTTNGKIHLKISSTETRPVTIPGLVSCFESADCPTGQTCQDNMMCM